MFILIARNLRLAAGGLLVALLAACGVGPTGGAADERPKVVATTTLVGDAVRSVAGELVELKVLLPPGADTHSYEPSPQDVAAIADADLVFVNGVGLEEFLEPLIENAGGDARVVVVSEGIELLEFGEPAGEHTEGEEQHAEGEEQHAEGEEQHAEGEEQHAEGEEQHAEGEEQHEHADDPHVWFSPANVEIWSQNIERALGEVDRTNAATYATNAQAYRTKLQELDRWIKDQVALVPEARRTLVTDHDTFGYLANRYGFELVGAVIPSVSSAAEPAPQDLAAIQQTINEHQVEAIFVASEASPALARQVAADTGAEVVFVYVESLSEPGGPADTYDAFMRYNVSAIVEALK